MIAVSAVLPINARPNVFAPVVHEEGRPLADARGSAATTHARQWTKTHLISALCFICLCHPVFSQSLRVTVGLTMIPVTVTDGNGVPVEGLTKERFRVYEDGVEQTVRFLQIDDRPLSVGVLFDASRSMTGKLDRSRSAIALLFQQATAGDEFLLVEFNDSPRLIAAYTTDTSYIQSKLMDIVPRNWTALLDAVYLGVQYSRKARYSRRAMLILSDGEDNHSRYSEGEIRSLVRESDVAIYGLGIESAGFLNRQNRVLKNLAQQTGGLYFPVGKISELPEAVGKISEAMHGMYVLSYRSSSQRPEELYRRVEVRVDAPVGVRWNVSHRRGYVPAAP